MAPMTVAFESKAPHTTPWLSIEYPVGERPADLLIDLAGIGWTENERFTLPPLDGTQELELSPPTGTAFFGGWTPAEAKRNMPPVRRLLRRYGFDRVPWNRLTLEDLL